jgi:hypothetical protein
VSIPTTGLSRRFGKIPDATSYSGIARTQLYELAARHKGLFRKNGTSTLVDFQILDRILDELPEAKIAAPRSP